MPYLEPEDNDDDDRCPKCGHDMAYERCNELGCEDGEYLDEDGINGDSWEMCSDCRGKGFQQWCRNCGWDNVHKGYMNGKSTIQEMEADSSEA